MNRSILAVSVLLAACSRRSTPAPDASASTPAPNTEAAVAWADLLAAEDRREVPALEKLANASSPEQRRRAALALGRTQDPAAAAALRRLTGDEVAAVRQAAAFGMGLLGASATPDDERTLLGRLASEPEPAGRAALADALGRIGGDPSLPALAALLQDADASVRVQAAMGLGSFALRKKAVGPARISALVERLDPAEPPAVRAGAAYALGRLAPWDPETAANATRAVESVLASPDPESRYFAARALAQLPPGPTKALLAHVDDPDWRVRVNVARALAKRGGAAAAKAALEASFVRARREGLDSPETHVLAAALEVAADLVDNPALRAEVQQVHDALLALPGPSTAKDLLHCLAALALDRASNWPRFVLVCGTPTMPAGQHQVLEARLLGASRGDDVARAGRLSRLLTSPDPRVRAAVVEAAAAIDNEPARTILRRGLADPDIGVIGTAADGIEKNADHFRTITSPRTEPPPEPRADGGVPPIREPDGGLAALTLAPLAVAEPAVVDKLVELLGRLDSESGIDALLSVVHALGALHAAASGPRLVPLLRHPVLAVRLNARDAYRSVTGETAPRPGPPVPPPHTIDVAEAVRIAIGPPHHAAIATTRGVIRIELLGRDAPATVLNFVTLARTGLYRDRPFHRVVPNFVIQGGDPRGDGYGGPGYTIRCELGATPYERGAVGMALAGPDTGGSQFFVMHSRQPHLDGRYTLFGRVVAGQDVVDRIVPGDRVTAVTIE